jgi:hypothetical protein
VILPETKVITKYGYEIQTRSTTKGKMTREFHVPRSQNTGKVNIDAVYKKGNSDEYILLQTADFDFLTTTQEFRLDRERETKNANAIASDMNSNPNSRFFQKAVLFVIPKVED